MSIGVKGPPGTRVADADLLALQDGLHAIVQTPDGALLLARGITALQTFGPLFEPDLVEAFQRFVAKGRRNDSRSYSVGVQPIKILERDESRIFALIFNGSQPTAAVQTDVDNSATTNAAAAIAATLAAAAGATTYITGFEITGSGATAASVIAITVTGILGGTKTYYLAVPAGVSVGVSLVVEFGRPIPASALNTAIVVSVPSFGAGNVNAAVTAHGYQLIPAIGAATVYIGGRQVTAGAGNDPNAGIPVAPGALLPFRLDTDIGELFAVANAAGVDLRVLDVSGGL